MSSLIFSYLDTRSKAGLSGIHKTLYCYSQIPYTISSYAFHTSNVVLGGIA